MRKDEKSPRVLSIMFGFGRKSSGDGSKDYSEGKRAYDCAQLARWCMNAVGITLVSGATSQWEKTAWAEKGERFG